MRWGIGLVSLLVVLLIGLFAFKWLSVPTIEQARPAQRQAEQLSGHGPDGLPASESVKLEPEGKNGRTEALRVTEVVPGGAIDQYFGLKKGDRIVKIGEFNVRDYPGGEQMAQAALYEAAQRNQPIVIQRDGQSLTITPANAFGAGAGRPTSVKIPMH